MIANGLSIEEFLENELKDNDSRVFIPHLFKTNTAPFTKESFEDADIPIGVFEKYNSFVFSISESSAWSSLCVTEFILSNKRLVLDFETFSDSEDSVGCVSKSISYMNRGMASVTPKHHEMNIATYAEVAFDMKDFLNLITQWKTENL
jgi:hypothetical protein